MIDKKTIHEEVLSQLWKLADTAQALSEGLYEDDDEGRTSLADDLKTLNRALLIFHGISLDDVLKANPERHWHMRELREKELDRVQKIGREE